MDNIVLTDDDRKRDTLTLTYQHKATSDGLVLDYTICHQLHKTIPAAFHPDYFKGKSDQIWDIQGLLRYCPDASRV
jgi:hypothetical protein